MSVYGKGIRDVGLYQYGNQIYWNELMSGEYDHQHVHRRIVHFAVSPRNHYLPVVQRLFLILVLLSMVTPSP